MLEAFRNQLSKQPEVTKLSLIFQPKTLQSNPHITSQAIFKLNQLCQKPSFKSTGLNAILLGLTLKLTIQTFQMMKLSRRLIRFHLSLLLVFNLKQQKNTHKISNNMNKMQKFYIILLSLQMSINQMLAQSNKILSTTNSTHTLGFMKM